MTKKSPNRPITLREVAKAADVSYQTVSRAVNDLPGINPETRSKVLRVVKELGYRRNSVAGSLRTNRSRAIGIVISDVENTFFGEIVQSVETEAYERGYSVVLANSSEDLAREQAAVGNLLERRVDGLILAPAGGSHDYLVTEAPANFPIVAINRALTERETASVLVKNSEGAREATEHLIRKGHRKIGALIGNLALMTSQERLAGFKEAMEAGGCDIRSEWIREGGIRRNTGRLAALEILSQPERPSALFASSGSLTEGALLAMRDLGLRHGFDIDLVGFDLTCWDLLTPPVPILRQPTYEIGRRAVRLLLDMIEGKPITHKNIRLAGQLEAEPDLTALRKRVEDSSRT